MTNKLSALTCACTLTLGLTSAQAALLGEYTFDSNSAAATNVASVVDMDDWVANVGDINSENARLPTGDGAGGTFNTPTGVDPTNPYYHQFSFTVQNLGAGETLSITSVSGDFFGGSLHPGGHRFQLYSDQVGYANTGQALDGVQIDIDDVTPTASFDISTSSIANLSNLSNGETVEFRFYWGDNGNNNGFNGRLDNIELNGTVIPEPGSYALLGGCLALAWVMVRRRRA